MSKVITSWIVPEEFDVLNIISAPSAEGALLNAISDFGVPVDVEPLNTASAPKLPEVLFIWSNCCGTIPRPKFPEASSLIFSVLLVLKINGAEIIEDINNPPLLEYISAWRVPSLFNPIYPPLLEEPFNSNTL